MKKRYRSALEVNRIIDLEQLQSAPRHRIGILAGRCHNRPKGTSATQSLYRHGGLTFMEVLTRWLILGPVEGGRT